jgi:hypothetical protein
LLLPEALLLFLVAVLYHPEAAPEDLQPKKVAGQHLLPTDDPIAFLKKCLKRYDREVRSYSVIFHKQELIKGRLQNPEEIQVHFREQPFSIYFEWLRGARRAERCVYVEGENNNMFLGRPYGTIARLVVGDVVERDLDGADAKGASRYSFKSFGLKNTMAQTLASWEKAKAANALHVKYLGVHKLPEVDNRECYTLRRAPYEHPEDEGITELTAYIDKETLLQVGTVLKGEGGKLIAFYFFHDLHLNPTFDKDYFQRAALFP